MKKLFLIPLLACFSCVMAWGATVEVGTFAELKSAINSASDGDVIKLTGNITGSTSNSSANVLNITKSITIDGQGNTLKNCGNYSVFRVNQGVASPQLVTITIKDLKMIQPEGDDYGIASNSSLEQLTLDNCDISCAAGGNPHAIIIAGPAPEGGSKLLIKNSHINATKSGYPIRFMCPLDITMENTNTEGYCGVYFERAAMGYAGSQGARGSSLYAKNCNFDAPNVHSGSSDSFSVFPIYDDGVSIILENCGINAEVFGSASQVAFDFGYYAPRKVQDVTITLKGDNTHINGTYVSNNFVHDGENYYNGYNHETNTYDATKAFDYTTDITLTIEGGTYAVNPAIYSYRMSIATEDPETHQPLTWDTKNINIPAGYEVQTIKQGDVTLYRVVKKAQEKSPGVMYDLNDYVPVEGEGYGDNPVSSFDLSTGTGMTLNNEVTTAGYVQVSDNEDTGVATTVTVGQTAGGDDQTLVINNGLDVQGESQVIVESGATLKIGEGGINTQKPENIVIEANENGAASLLLDPTITVNQTPNLTVRMTAKQIGRDASNDYFWHRFAMPVAGISTWEKEGSLVGTDYPTYLYAWDYDNNDWANIAPNAMEPLQGYTLTLASEYIDGTAADGHLNVLQDVVYTFKGNLVGNTDQPLNFQHEGFNFFGNSYTGYMDVKTMLQGLEDGHIDGTAYMWNTDEQIYVGVSLLKLIKGRGLENWQKEVAPMQTFILRLRGADTANEEVNYAAAIWGNPNRYGNNGGSSPAPRRRVADINEDTYMEIAVKAANGKTSRVDFTESANNSDAFESGYDVEKYMNEKTINLYASVNGMNLSSVVTDNIEGKTLSLQTNGEIAYTMSFKNVEGTEYAIRDNATNQVIAIEEGATYEFAAQPNSTIEGRFEIIPVAKMPTAIENTEVKANAKGIYTIMGQYLGDDFDILPAGVYVVDGVKIVK